MRHLLLAAVVTLAGLAPAAPAAGHEGSGTIRMAATTPASDAVIGYEVTVTFADDGHPAGDATVTAVVEQDGVPPLTPVPLTATAQEGRYAGRVRFPSPGRWIVRFNSVSPVGTLERSEVIEGSTSAPTPEHPNRPNAATGPAAQLDSEGAAAGNMGLVGLVLALGGLGVIAALMVRSTRRTRRTPPPRP